MKTQITASQIKSITSALEMLNKRTFTQRSGNPVSDAQLNLSGLTHYVDDETLRWHKSRVCSTARLCGGLLFRVTTSDALDMNNTKRGFRSVVFDVFGTVVSRPELQDAEKTSEKAIAKSNAVEFDVMAHYQKSVASELSRAESHAAKLREVAAMLA